MSKYDGIKKVATTQSYECATSKRKRVKTKEGGGYLRSLCVRTAVAAGIALVLFLGRFLPAPLNVLPDKAKQIMGFNIIEYLFAEDSGD